MHNCKLATSTCLVLLSLCTVVNAQSGRDGNFEFSLQIPYIDGENLDFEGGAQAAIDGDYGFGVGFYYYFSDRFAGTANITWHTTDYRAERVLDDANGTLEFLEAELDTYSVNVGGEYYFSETRLSPFVNASVGWKLGSIPTSPAACRIQRVGGTPGSAWFAHPIRLLMTNQNFSYSAGVGLRWAFTDRNFLKAGYYQNWLEYDNATGSDNLGSWRLELGFSF